jgi:hypothetical protein
MSSGYSCPTACSHSFHPEELVPEHVGCLCVSGGDEPPRRVHERVFRRASAREGVVTPALSRQTISSRSCEELGAGVRGRIV